VIESLQSFQNVFKIPELKRRVLMTAVLLIAYRLGAHVPTPGIDGHALSQFFEQVQGTLLGMVDLFSGGNLRRLSIFALGIMPYISASIILQLLTVVIPTLERLAKEGEAGRKKITQYTRYGTIVLSAVQALGIAYGLESMRSPEGLSIVPTPGWGFRLLTMVTLTACGWANRSPRRALATGSRSSSSPASSCACPRPSPPRTISSRRAS